MVRVALTKVLILFSDAYQARTQRRISDRISPLDADEPGERIFQLAIVQFLKMFLHVKWTIMKKINASCLCVFNVPTFLSKVEQGFEPISTVVLVLQTAWHVHNAKFQNASYLCVSNVRTFLWKVEHGFEPISTVRWKSTFSTLVLWVHKEQRRLYLSITMLFKCKINLLIPVMKFSSCTFVNVL